MKLRKLVTTMVIAAIFFWAPSVVPVRAFVLPSCGGIAVGWQTADTAFAGVPILPPCPIHTATPWVVIIGAASVVSVIVNAAIVGKTQCRELTQQEAWSSVFLPFIGYLWNQQNNKCGGPKPAGGR